MRRTTLEKGGWIVPQDMDWGEYERHAKTRKTCITLCTGIGGLDLGVELAGEQLAPLAYVEIEAYAVARLVAGMEEGQLAKAPIFTNLKSFPTENFRGAVDLVLGGYPCQPFSSAGKKLGAADPRHLWPFIRKLIADLEPKRCFFENVGGHVTLGLSSVLADLVELGYKTTAGLFTAAEVGAWHQRKRVFIVADAYRQRAASQRHQWGFTGRKGTSRGSVPVESDSYHFRHQPQDEVRSGRYALVDGCFRGGTERSSILVEQLRKHKFFRCAYVPEVAFEPPRMLTKKNGTRILNPDWVDGYMGFPASYSSLPASWTKNDDPERLLPHRIRALGNAVVPQQAALAYQTLTNRLEDFTQEETWLSF